MKYKVQIIKGRLCLDWCVHQTPIYKYILITDGNRFVPCVYNLCQTS